MRVFFAPLTVVLLFAHATLAWGQAGEYSLVEKGLAGHARLILEPDMSFEFKVITDVQGSSTFSGTWHLKKDTVILRVISPFNDDSLNRKDRLICKPADRNKITILVEDSTAFPLAKVYINSGSAPIHLNDSAQAFVKEKIRKVIIRYQGIIDREFIIDSSSCNDVTVILYDKLFLPSIYSVAIRKWLIVKQGLIPLRTNGKRFREMFVKTRTSNAF